MSLPLRERGLKLHIRLHDRNLCKSLPLRERGLKPAKNLNKSSLKSVAPLAGAWIETKYFDVSITLAFGRSPCGSVD